VDLPGIVTLALQIAGPECFLLHKREVPAGSKIVCLLGHIRP
jgi:hypothetical protein